ncbi:hypothetical protein Plec18167_005967 [Paecilomyces lecythidis]|uniref:Protein-arginine deiminase C-terminal domain-containing protein n=1 Tax=Paecilomyces lecythidis TaxID=3004212 RepID=A0ABR3XEH9_9EURO
MWQSSFILFLLAVRVSLAQDVSVYRPDIRADTNRDGVVDMEGSSDSGNKVLWTSDRGAIFLPNVGDKTRRCPRTDLNGLPLSNEELAPCNDASGQYLLAPEYVAPLKTMPLPVDIPNSTIAKVYAIPRAAYERVRIFLLEDPSKPNITESWRIIDKGYEFCADQLRAGLTLGVDGREFITDLEVWDGLAVINFDVYPRPEHASPIRDAVSMKVAPVLTHNHLQDVEIVVSTSSNNTTPAQEYFLSQLDKTRLDLGIRNPLYLFNGSDDIWAQDFVEPAYASMPGPNGPISIRIMLRSAQSSRAAGRQVLEQIRGPGIGAYQPDSSKMKGVKFDYDEIDSYGNLETIPPYRSKSGVYYPAGRVISGKHFENLPARSIRDFFAGQGLQTMFLLETAWLHVGHVDEFMHFIPYPNDLGFTVVLGSPKMAIDILKEVQSSGHGHTRAISFDYSQQMKKLDQTVPPHINMTVDEFLDNRTLIKLNAYAQKWIDVNRNILLSEIPLDDEDIIEVPILFENGTYYGSNSSDYEIYWEPTLKDEYKLSAFQPAVINGIVIGDHYISPDPFGPVVDGMDLYANAVKDAYARAGMNVTFIDDYYSHHLGGGEIHCGSNTMRQTDQIWWK